MTIFEALGGMDGLRRLAEAWHHRVLDDEVVAHAFSHGYHPQHTERLAAYWAEALGGPAIYSGRYGSETSVVRMHSGNGPHEEMDQRAIACFDQALDDIGVARTDRLWRVLHDYFAWATTHTMNRYHHSAEDVPEGLSLPKWSWDGLETEVAMTRSRVLDLKAFVPAKDLEISRRFYTDLGFTEKWHNDQVAEFEVGGFRFLLQKFYVKEHAGNFMMQLHVEDADDWWKRISSAGLQKKYQLHTLKPPTLQPWGLRVLYLSDPSGVLWHIADKAR